MRKKILLIIAIVVVLILLTAMGFYNFLKKEYAGRVYPHVYLGELDLSGLNQAQVASAINSRIADNFSAVTVFYKDTKKPLLLIWPPGSELAENWLSFDEPKSTNLVLGYGRGNSGSNFWPVLKAYFFGTRLTPVYNFDQDIFSQALLSEFDPLKVTMQNASLEIIKEDKDILELGVKSEQAGESLDYPTAISDLQDNLADFVNRPIILESTIVEPEIFKSQISDPNGLAKSFLDLAPLSLEYQATGTSALNQSFKIDKKIIVSWLSFSKDRFKSVELKVDRSKLENYLKTEIASKIDSQPQITRFEIKNGRVTSFQSKNDGLSLDIAKTVDLIIDNFAKSRQSKLVLLVNVVKAEDSINPNEFEVREIIGTGHSNFAGSPANRRHNIKVGAAAVNGTLLKPGEEFSLVKVLGDVDEKSGYLPELVIKDNKTIPEFGGGLCQIGTTVFRAALYSGLPITERRNHSYRVAYYEPAGMDATIYIPKPDFRFVNDTGNYVIIQSRISGNDIYFDFWGVSDGRKIEVSKPTIYNIVKPAPTRIVETTDLKPGEKKCTEKAHNGADAYFDYVVTYKPGASDENKVSQRFSSHYVPWQEVCLLGVSATSSSSGLINNSTSTQN